MNLIGLQTLILKELKRNMRTPLQTFGAPVITTLLYFIIFGQAFGSRIGSINGIDYTSFIMPGLIMMNVLTTSFQGVGFGVMFQRVVGRTINDILVSPMSYFEIAAGFTIASVIRSSLVGFLIFLTSLFFVPAVIMHPLLLLVFLVLVSTAFSLLGFIVGLWANSFEQLSIFPTFILMPLSFLGGVFYSIDMLPPLAAKISLYNPFFYMMNGMRYAFFGFSDTSTGLALAIVVGMVVVLAIIVTKLLQIGYNLKT